MSTENFTYNDKIFSRFLSAIKATGKNKTQIANIMGYSKQQVGDIVEGKTKLSDRFCKIFCMKFNISEKWLQTGEGEMYESRTHDRREYNLDASYSDQILLGSVFEELTEAYFACQDEAKKKKFIDELGRLLEKSNEY